MEIFNERNRACELAASLNRMYGTGAAVKQAALPEEMGRGAWLCVQTAPSVEMVISEATFNQSIMFASQEQGDHVSLGICLGEDLRWEAEGSNREFGLNAGEIIAYCNVKSRFRCQYDAGRPYRGVTLRLRREGATDALQLLPMQKLSAALSGNTEYASNRPMTPGMMRVARDIVACRYTGDIRHMYVSGKAWELIALYLNEIMMENALPQGLSRTDVDKLRQAKEIVDANLFSPHGLSKLSRLVCLNEYKLKKGFKLLYGMPVHAYIIDRRLDIAYSLLEEGKLNVTGAALAVGFGKASHFSAQFKKKYGFPPSVYFQSTN